MKTNSTYVKTGLLLAMLIPAAITVEAQRGRRNYHYANSYYPIYGQRVSNIPGPFISVSFGGNPYYYANGAYYRQNAGYYQVSYPPFGLRVNVLPRDYYPVVGSGNPYYYSNGIFYRQSERNRDYEVIQAPIGAEVPSLPSDTKTMVIDGEKFYSFNGSYFKDVVKANGELWYKVVGKNGVLNTYKNSESYPQQQPQQSYPQQPYPQQAPQQQYPQQVPQQYPQQKQTYPQQQEPQQFPPSPPRQDMEPVIQEQPATNSSIVKPAPVITQPAQQSIPQNNGVREAVRRNPNQPTTQQEEQADSTQWSAPDLILHDNPDIGWVVDRLPENSKTIIISKKKYFVSPNNTYYEEYVDEKRQVRYKVVGKDR